MDSGGNFLTLAISLFGNPTLISTVKPVAYLRFDAIVTNSDWVIPTPFGYWYPGH